MDKDRKRDEVTKVNQINRFGEFWLSLCQSLTGSLVIWWLIATVGGFIVSLCLIEVGERTDMEGTEGLLGGALIGFTQSLVLRKYISGAWFWPMINQISWGIIGFSSIKAVGWMTPVSRFMLVRLFNGAAYGLLVGLILGVSGWLLFRFYVEKGAWRWILANTVAWSYGLGIGWGVGGILRQITNMYLGDIFGLGLCWLIVSVITGWSLVQLIND